MPPFSVNANRCDPYKGFRFRVRWDGRHVPDVHKVTGLRWAPPRPWPAPEPEPGPMIALGEQARPTGWKVVGDAITGVLERVRNPRSTRAGAFAAPPSPVRHWARLVIERGRTHDTSLEQWADEAVAAARTGQGSVSVRKDVIIEVQNEAGQTALAFKAFACVPVEYVPIGELNANRSDVLIERLVVEYDRAERDQEVFEPAEPSFPEPPEPEG
ncbi:MAG: phage tail protein [Actinobacteria bacterium]|nr:MAG: phage tail protein [Actinomycetota bacterium]